MIIADLYELQDEIGTGGMGIVYRGANVHTGEEVAIKRLRPDRTTPGMVERFAREGEALRQLNHPNIVKMLDTIQEDGQSFLVMELVAGGSLRDELDASPQLPVERVLTLALELADALTRAHHLKIIHRDIKPANVLLAEDGTPRLTDFGLARAGDSEITESGEVMGTTTYIAPELLAGEAAHPGSDIWAFGVMLFEMLAGQRPFTGPTVAAMVTAIISSLTPDLEKICPDVPIELIDLIYRMLAKNPAERIPSIRLVGAELEAIMQGRTLNTPLTLGSSGQIAAAPVDRRFITPTPSGGQVNDNFPALATPFVGRTAELEALDSLLARPEVRLVTIMAPGGMGKTRLGIEAATRQRSRFADGVCFVPLAPLSAAEHIIPAAATALGFNFSAGDSKQQLLNFLREKELLLVMDNFEHLSDGKGLVSDFLDAAPGLKVLATSRARLNLGAEFIFEVGGMRVPEHQDEEIFEEIEAVEMFIAYARRSMPGFELEAGHKKSVVRICRLVHGVPLALELAAGWARMLPPDEIAVELETDIDFLESEREDLPVRQRSMRAVFDYSWNLLAEPEQQALMKFSVFRGGASRRAAQQVSGTGLRALTTLVDQSLIARDPKTGDFSIHELLRQLAEERLDQSGLADDVRSAHSSYYLEALWSRLPDIKGRDQKQALADIEDDFENVRAAWLWAVKRRMTDPLSRSIDSLFLFLYVRTRFSDIETMFELTWKALASEGDDQVRQLYGKTLARRWGHLQLFQLDFGNAKAQVEEAHRIAVEFGDPFEIAFTILMRGYAAYQIEEDGEKAVALFEDCLERFRELGDPYYIAWALHRVGFAHLFLGNYDLSFEFTKQSLEIARKTGDHITATNCLFNNGSLYLRYGDYENARQWFAEAVEISSAINPRLWFVLHSKAELSLALICLGRFDEARLQAESGLKLDKSLGFQSTYLRTAIILLACLDERYDDARQVFEEALTMANNPFGEVILGWAGALVMCAANDHQMAIANLQDTWAGTGEPILASNKSNIGFTMMYLGPVAYVLATLGDYERAAELLGVIMHHPRSPMAYYKALPLMQALEKKLTLELGADAYTAALKRGQSPDLEGIVNDLGIRLKASSP